MEPEVSIKLEEGLIGQGYWEEVCEEFMDLFSANGGMAGWEIVLSPLTAHDENTARLSESDEDDSRYEVNHDARFATFWVDVNLWERKGSPRKVAEFLAGFVLPRSE